MQQSVNQKRPSIFSHSEKDNENEKEDEDEDSSEQSFKYDQEEDEDEEEEEENEEEDEEEDKNEIQSQFNQEDDNEKKAFLSISLLKKTKMKKIAIDRDPQEYNFGRVEKIVSTEEKSLEKPKKTKNIIKRKFENRLCVRFFCSFFIPLVLIAIFLTLYHASKSQDSFSYAITTDTKVFLEMNQCLLYLNEIPQNGSITGSHSISFDLSDLTNTSLVQSSFQSNWDSELKNLNISIISFNENVKSCNLHLNLPPNLVSTFSIKCEENCYIIQEHHSLQVEKLKIKAKHDIHTNFRRIEVDELNFQADLGVLQLNSFQINKKAHILINNGDIILQSEKDLLLNWKNQQQTFCFASPFVNHESILDCAIADNEETAPNSELTTCKGKTTICASKTCEENMPTLNISQSVGNLYVNRINEPYKDIEYVEDYQTSKGLIYTKGVSFDPIAIAGIDAVKEEASESGTDQIFIVDIGKKPIQSKRNSLWTVISNPSYAYIRPWWLATFSLSLLTANSYEVNGYLSPGFCPYHIEANIQQIYETQMYLDGYFALNNSVISYVNPDFHRNPIGSYRNGTGFFDFERSRPTNENWVSVERNQEGDLEIIENNIDKNKTILIALILSFIFAALVGLTVLYIFKVAVMFTYKEILEKSKHCSNYINYIRNSNDIKPAEQNKKFNLKGILDEASFANFMREVPRLSAFIGFYSSNLMKKYMIDSVDEFLIFLMNSNLESQTIKANKGVAETKFIEMKEKTLKNYYEKFCFLNGLTEKQLSDEANMKKFNEYGFELIDDGENLIKAFTMMQINEKVVVDLSSNFENSLELFIESCVKNTKSETDTEYVDEFNEKYEEFCTKYRLQKCEVRHDKLVTDIKYKFGLKKIPRKKLVRKIIKNADDNFGNDFDKENKTKGFFSSLKNFLMKIVTFGSYVDKKTLRNKFLIDEKQLNYHFDVILNSDKTEMFEDLENKYMNDLKINEQMVTKHSVINKMIYHSYWYYWFSMDVLTILLHQFITALLVLPFLFLVLLHEITYSPFSVIDPDYLITMFYLFISFI